MSSTARIFGALAVAGLLVGARPAAPDVTLPIGDGACSSDNAWLPSCKPHNGWYCFHQGMLEPLFNFCDPNDANC